jgi:hypothetical protein
VCVEKVFSLEIRPRRTCDVYSTPSNYKKSSFKEASQTDFGIRLIHYYVNRRSAAQSSH